MRNINVALCFGRHEMPECVTHAILADCGIPYVTIQNEDGEDMRTFDCDNVHLTIYVTGLSVALIAAINAAHFGGIRHITLMHYDRETGEYYAQEVE